MLLTHLKVDFLWNPGSPFMKEEQCSLNTMDKRNHKGSGLRVCGIGYRLVGHTEELGFFFPKGN